MGKIIVGVIIVAAVVAFFVMRDTPEGEESLQNMKDISGEAMQKMETKTDAVIDNAQKAMSPAKEFSMTSFYDEKGAWFSIKEITVKRGDLVRIRVTNTKGMHDFTLDEFSVKEETPLNKETVIEFVADKAGTFEYYCSMPGHRARGQFGKLIVTE